jgi:hypothetical protein
MNRNPQDAVRRWRRRLALIAGACGLFLLNLAFVALPVAADGHGGSSGGHHDGQNVEAEHHGNDGPNHDVNDNRGNDVIDNDMNDNDVNDDRGNDGPNHDVNDNDANDNDVNDDRGNDVIDNDDAPVMVLIPMTVTDSGR